MPRKQSHRKRTNADKKGHLVRMLAYAVGNWETVQREQGRHILRAIARSFYLTGAGFRVLHSGHEIILAFQELTAWCDLLTPAQMTRSKAKVEKLATRAAAFPATGPKSARIKACIQPTAPTSAVVQTYYILVQLGTPGLFALGDGRLAGRPLPVRGEAPGARADPE